MKMPTRFQRMSEPCPGCGAIYGRKHRGGCDVELCPDCGGQYISCDCKTTTHARMPWLGIRPETSPVRGEAMTTSNEVWLVMDGDRPDSTWSTDPLANARAEWLRGLVGHGPTARTPEAIVTWRLSFDNSDKIPMRAFLEHEQEKARTIVKEAEAALVVVRRECAAVESRLRDLVEYESKRKREVTP